MDTMKIRMAAETNIGLRRRNNEDKVVICPSLSAGNWSLRFADTELNDGSFGAMLVMADGMGDMNAGEVAADIATETVVKYFSPQRLESSLVADENAILQYLKVVVSTADRRIKQRVYEDPTTWGMGTTIIVAWIYNGKAYIAWCGDSRAYMCNATGIRQLTRDHLYVQELLDAGRLDAYHAAMHPGRNRITRYLGDERQNVRPDTLVVPLAKGDTLLLCTDGLNEQLDDEAIAECVKKYEGNVIESCSMLIKSALDAGGNDNITVAATKKRQPKASVSNLSSDNFDKANFARNIVAPV